MPTKSPKSTAKPTTNRSTNKEKPMKTTAKKPAPKSTKTTGTTPVLPTIDMVRTLSGEPLQQAYALVLGEDPKPRTPVPATVVIVPETSTLRMRASSGSATYRLPLLSKASPCGEISGADVAGPPSPAYPSSPVPAAVEILPLGSIFRSR